ncbi:LytR/AlgR family response regulator transcription factor [Flagellimonas sp.]|uniref:LytR/AlgR family response regulator transcription factor n=1 Tax=Flagellimonas sp. TaxID=2058762 RepID=UPI003B5BF96C
MTTQKLSKANNKLLNANFRVIILFGIIIYGLAILQDYLFSRFKSTGFYWSDTMLYNIYWLLFIPFIKFANYVYSKIQPKTLLNKFLYALLFGIVFSVLHIFLFTSIFILLSNAIYPIPHRFLTILKNVISNQSQITIITYLFLPFIIEYLNRKKQQKKDISIQKFITVKNGPRRIKIDASTVLFVQTDRPYTAVFSINQKLLHDESLKKLEELLDPKVFIRIHRSVIINKNHITEIKSRKNGDYDGILTNGQSVRFSRHYRQNWNVLLNH